MKKLLSLMLMLACSVSMWAGNMTEASPSNVIMTQPTGDFDYYLEKVPWMVGKWKAKTEYGTEYTTYNSDGTFKVSMTLSNHDAKQALSLTITIGGTYGYSSDYAAVVCVYDPETYTTKVNTCKGFTQDEINEFSAAMKEAFMEEETFMIYPMTHSSAKMTFRDQDGAVLTYTKATSSSKKK